MAIEVPPPPAPTTPNSVNVGWMVFVPATITVPVGTTVTWTNVDVSNHIVTFPDQK
jgi:plastocyanin